MVKYSIVKAIILFFSIFLPATPFLHLSFSPGLLRLLLILSSRINCGDVVSHVLDVFCLLSELVCVSVLKK